MDIFEEEKLLEQAKSLGARVQSRLEAFQEEFELIGDVRGLGPMMAMELVTEREQKTPASHETRALIKYCFDSGLILLACGTYGNVIRLVMPLMISDAQLNQGLDIIYDGLAFVQNNSLTSNRTCE
jgi:4-aminobutyrate aminotransferase / (S)-3-amino-2-methylpropionate transaminase / 5-aminovalerate transaminase